MNKKPNAFEVLRMFQEDRPLMKEANNDVDYLVFRMLQEVAEFQGEPKGMSKEMHMEQELADIAIFAIQILDIITGDADLALRSKAGRNVLKYPSFLFKADSGNTFDEAIVKSKAQWSEADNEDFFSEL